MKSGAHVFSSRLGRRILALFLGCAVMPVVVLAGVCLSKVNAELEQQARHHRKAMAKTLGLALVERLQLLAEDIRQLALRSSTLEGEKQVDGSAGLSRVGRYDGLTLRLHGGKWKSFWGEPLPVEELTEMARLASVERPRLKAIWTASGIRFFLGARVAASHGATGVLVAEVSSDYLFASRDGPGPGTQVLVLDENGLAIHSTLGEVTADFRAQSFIEATAPAANQDLEIDGATYAIDHRSIFLSPVIDMPTWRIYVLEDVDHIHSAARAFRWAFFSVVAMTLCAVLYLSQLQVRRILEPLCRLTAGTRRLAHGELDSRVPVEASGDELHSLAVSFNLMAQELSTQFQAVRATSEIVQAVLSRLDRESIATAFLRGAAPMLGPRQSGLFILDPGSLDHGVHYRSRELEASGTPTRLEAKDLQSISAGGREDILIVAGRGLPPLLATGARNEGVYLVIPIRRGPQLCGCIWVQFENLSEIRGALRASLRQLADQIAMALANAQLITELDDLSLGTMKALARTVDAKSMWTAGHSERVTHLAVCLARAHGLSAAEIELIRRGSLLHDIGKIGVPNEILDKQARLTPEEEEVVKAHPVIGVRILEPIAPFRVLLPIVRHHHERLDGRGYPDGLRGDQLSLAVRIVTVADCFDAMTSDRPYRSGLPLAEAQRILQAGVGSQFDPDVVATLLTLDLESALAGSKSDAELVSSETASRPLPERHIAV